MSEQPTAPPESSPRDVPLVSRFLAGHPESHRGTTRAAALGLVGTAGIAGLLSAAISVLPDLNAWWQLVLLLGVALVGLAGFVWCVLRSVRSLFLYDPTREIASYTYQPETGVLLKGTVRNVSLRVETLHTMINEISQCVLPEDRPRALHEAGCLVGRSWAVEFREQHARMGPEDFSTMLLWWAYYDASAGMGRLSIAVSPEKPTGTVLLANSFLSTMEASCPLNHWFAGYIQGSLEGFLERRVVVTLWEPTETPQDITMFDVTLGEPSQKARGSRRKR